MRTIHVALDERSYPIYIEAGSREKLGQLYSQHELGRRAAIITDKNVEKLYGAATLAQLKHAGVDAQLIPVPPGESSKSLEWLDKLYTRLIWAGFDRDTTLVALGGGVVGDLAGFVAATYLRGVRWVHVPTTLLAQVDAAIGGKTGINHRLGKNLIGAFHQPRFVLIDPQFLRTLPERERWAGLAEITKYGCIYDGELFAQLEAHLRVKGVVEELEKLIPLIERSVQIKSQIVSADEREAGQRALLNFGHTLGHALEAATKYQRFLHGEAVAWGMLAEGHLSHKRGWLAREDFERIAALLGQFPKPSLPPDLERESFLGYIGRDKKARQKQIRVVLLRAIGQAALTEVEEIEIREALEDLRVFS